MAKSVGQILVRLGLATEGLDRNLKRSYRQLSSFEKFTYRTKKNISRNFSNIGATLGVIGAGALFAGALRDISNFEQSVANLASISGKSAEQIKPLIESAKAIGARSAFSASQVVELQTELAKLGFSEREILQSAEAIGAFSIAVGTDAAQAAALGGAAIRAFGLDASRTEDVVSTLAVATTKSALDFEKLQVALPYVATAASQMGISIERTAGLMGVLADRGLQSSKIGTSLRAIFLKVASSGGTLEESLSKINGSQNKLATATELFGEIAAGAAVVLAENTTEVDKLEASITNVNPALKEMTDKRLATLQGQLTLTKSAWEGFILSVDSGDGVFSRLSKQIAGTTTTLLAQLTALNEGTLSVGSAFSIGSSGDFAKSEKELESFNKKINSLPIDKIIKDYGKYQTELNNIFKLRGTNDNRAELLEKERELLRKITVTEKNNSIIPLVKKVNLKSYNKELEETRSELKKITAAESYLDKLIKSRTTASDVKPPIAAEDIITTTTEDNTLGNQITKQTEKVESLKNALLSLVPNTKEYKNAIIELTASQIKLNNLNQQLEPPKIDTKKIKQTFKGFQGLISDGLTLPTLDVKTIIPETTLTAIAKRVSEINAEITRIGDVDTITEANRVKELTDELKELGEYANLIEPIKLEVDTTKATSDLSIFEQTLQEAFKITEDDIKTTALNAFSSIQLPHFSEANENLKGLNSQLRENQEILSNTDASDSQRDAAEANILSIKEQIAAEQEKANVFKQVTSEVINTTRERIKASLAEAIAGALAKSLSTLGLFALPLAAAGAAGISALFDTLIPKLAQGGITTGPQLALIGDNPSGKEAVIPLERFDEIFGKNRGSNNVVVSGVIKGSDIHLSNKRGSFVNDRFR